MLICLAQRLIATHSGGFALLATTATVPLLPSVLAPLGMVGVVGAAGLTMMSLAECGGPFRCVSSSGQCCMLLINLNGAICPASC